MEDYQQECLKITGTIKVSKPLKICKFMKIKGKENENVACLATMLHRGRQMVFIISTYLCFPLMGPLKSGSYFSGSPVNDKHHHLHFCNSHHSHVIDLIKL